MGNFMYILAEDSAYVEVGGDKGHELCWPYWHTSRLAEGEQTAASECIPANLQLFPF